VGPARAGKPPVAPGAMGFPSLDSAAGMDSDDLGCEAGISQQRDSTVTIRYPLLVRVPAAVFGNANLL
jgi:hypothetical protein